MINHILKIPKSNSLKQLLNLKKSNFNRTCYHRNESSKAKFAVHPEIITSSKELKYIPGNSYEGFICKQVEYIEDFNMTAYKFEHEIVGTEYLHIDRNDSNNAFSVNFRTTPFNSTGVPHILEHTVLCGSAMYPVRDPFFKMLTRSVATFLNAMTGPDYTFYPFSSVNKTDYYNLQKIYLDAVFRPNLRYTDFLQEGWRLEHSDLNNKKSAYVFKGVVFNEMKGAFSDNSSVFGENLLNKILPDHTYGFISGGDPLHIPRLTHCDLVEFHEKYYHPSNCRMFSYGNNDVINSLKYINETYMKDYIKIDTSYSKIPSQKKWNEAKRYAITSRYDNMGVPLEKQNQIAISYMMSDITDIYETFVMIILTELLVRGPNSCFYKSLIEPNISGGYNPHTGFENHIKNTLFIVGLQDLNKNNFEKVEDIVNKTIEDVIKNGFSKDHIDSVLHSIELNLKHQTTRFGLGLLFNITPLWNHDGDVIRSLQISKLLTQLRDNLAHNPEYLQQKVEQYFQRNNHKLTLTMTPDVEYENKFIKLENELLEEKVKSLTEEDKEKIYKDGLLLQNLQKTEENSDILPCLKLSDLPIEIEKHDLSQEIFESVPLQICSANTNGLIYYRGILDASNLTKEQILLLPLFTTVINQFGTKNYSYSDFDKLTQTKTSGINFSIHFTENLMANNKYEIGILFGSYCLLNNTTDMFDILKELLLNYNMNDLSRFEMLLENYVSSLSLGIVQSGHLYSMQSSSSLLNESSKLKESIMGIEHITFIKNYIQINNKEEILRNLNEIGKALFGRSNLRSSLHIDSSLSNEKIGNIIINYKNFTKQLPELNWKGKIWNQSKCFEQSSNIHHILNIPVNYCSKSFVTVPYLHSDYAPLKVLSKLLTSKYLLPTIREQNGAYGAGARIGFDGIFSFYSYRDPNSIDTLERFDNAHLYLNENKLTDQLLFEAKLGVLQGIDIPISPSDKGMDNFKYELTHESFSKHRRDILNVSTDQIMAVNEKYLQNNELTVAKCVLGPENKDIVESKDKKWIISKSE